MAFKYHYYSFSSEGQSGMKQTELRVRVHKIIEKEGKAQKEKRKDFSAKE